MQVPVLTSRTVSDWSVNDEKKGLIYFREWKLVDSKVHVWCFVIWRLRRIKVDSKMYPKADLNSSSKILWSGVCQKRSSRDEVGKAREPQSILRREVEFQSGIKHKLLLYSAVRIVIEARLMDGAGEIGRIIPKIRSVATGYVPSWRELVGVSSPVVKGCMHRKCHWLTNSTCAHDSWISRILDFSDLGFREK